MISSWGSSGHCINFFVSSVISALRVWPTPVLLTVLNWFNSAVLVAGCERIFPSFSIAIGACLLSSLLRLLTSDHSLLPSFSRLRVDFFSFQLDLIADKLSFFSFAVLALREILFSMVGFSSTNSLAHVTSSFSFCISSVQYGR